MCVSSYHTRVIHEAEPLNCPSLVSMEDALKIRSSNPAAADAAALRSEAPSTLSLEEQTSLTKAVGNAQGNTMKIGLNLWFTDLPDYPRPEMSQEGESLGYASADVQQGN